MCIICETKNHSLLSNLTELNCYYCPLLTIPNTLIHLTILDCSYCPLLSSIPNTLIHLTELSCYNCPSLSSITNTLIHLTTLYCWKCPLLYIPIKYKKLTNTKSNNNMLRIRG
jgi:hypothetical protein